MLTRRVSIGDGAHRKKSHADGSSLFQWLSTAVRRSNFNPPNAAGRKEKHGKNELVVTRETSLARAGRRNQSAWNFRHDLDWRLRARKCETAGPAIWFPGRRRETELPRDRRRSKFTAWSSIGFDVVSKNVAGRAPWKNLRRVAAPVQNELAGLARRSPPLNLSKTGSMAPLDAALLAHRRKRASQIVVALRDFAGHRDE